MGKSEFSNSSVKHISVNLHYDIIYLRTLSIEDINIDFTRYLFTLAVTCNKKIK